MANKLKLPTGEPSVGHNKRNNVLTPKAGPKRSVNQQAIVVNGVPFKLHITMQMSLILHPITFKELEYDMAADKMIHTSDSGTTQRQTQKNTRAVSTISTFIKCTKMQPTYSKKYGPMLHQSSQYHKLENNKRTTRRDKTIDDAL